MACWGPDSWGESTPPAGTFTAVSADGINSSVGAHTCGVRTDSTLGCWGSDLLGQGTPITGTFVGVSAGHGHNCATRPDATTVCWGGNLDGQTTVPAGFG